MPPWVPLLALGGMFAAAAVLRAALLLYLTWLRDRDR